MIFSTSRLKLESPFFSIIVGEEKKGHRFMHASVLDCISNTKVNERNPSNRERKDYRDQGSHTCHTVICLFHSGSEDLNAHLEWCSMRT